MRARLFAMLLSAVCASSAGAEPGRYIIGFSPSATAAEKSSAVGRLGGAEVGAVDELGLVVAEVPDAARVQSLAADEMAALRITRIEEDVQRNWLAGVEPSMQLAPAPSLPTWDQIRAALPRFSRKGTAVENPLPADVTASEVPWGIRRVNAPAAWSVTQGDGVRVAIVDTGIDASHPDLAGQVAGGYNALDYSKPYFDDNAHGTHVAGTIAALRNGKGVVGVAPKARLYAVKVLDAKGSGGIVSIIKGLVWCARNDIQVANLSLGAPMGSVFLRLAVQYAASKGVTLVVAAGNSGGGVQYPAAYEGAIAVSASDEQDRIASFSSRGAKVEFIAPGVDINSTVPEGRYATHDGTSMATPHVAGLAALAVARGARGPDAVRAALAKAARPIGLAPAEQGRGMVDAAALVH